VARHTSTGSVERELQRDDMNDLPSPVIRSLHLLTTAMASAIEQLESYRPSERGWIKLWSRRGPNDGTDA
jgi:hypothetical protein